MAMVMPRSRSSGALSIWSKATYLLLALALASTLVMAAVNVVLPWSMWPMVPTFTCGFVLSNFFFAMSIHHPPLVVSAYVLRGCTLAIALVLSSFLTQSSYWIQLKRLQYNTR